MEQLSIESIFIEELFNQANYEFSKQHYKDIIIVVHNQLDYTKKCIETIYNNTSNFHLYIWDNGSDEETAKYLQEQQLSRKNFHFIRHDDNIGFIKPNNELAKLGNSPYIILLNNDTEVFKGWDTALIGWLIAKPEYGQVGYLGGILEENCQGGKARCGEVIDYVCGWCMCMPREVYDKYGLFDEKNLSFAYGEDADLSLRLLEAKYKIRALRLGLVIHHGNATIKEVAKTRDCRCTFDANHDYLRLRWADYLSKDRAMLRNSLSTEE
jgi:GT2 family glycosyltransferase